MSTLRFETVERSSLFTRLDFRTKLLIIVAIMGIGILWESPIANGILALLLVTTCLLVGVKISYIKSVIKLLIPFWLLLLLIHGFFSDTLALRLSGNQNLTAILEIPKHWWLIGGGILSVEGVLFGANVIFKTLSMVLSVPLVIFTTDSDSIIVGMVRSKIPYKVAFVFASTMRFFPLLFEEIQMIIEAQRLRGLALEKMNIFQKMNVYSKIGIPLILNAMAKSQQLEVVLQSKGFCGKPNRTYLHDSDLTNEDRIVMIFLLLLLTFIVILYFSIGVGKFPWLIY